MQLLLRQARPRSSLLSNKMGKQIAWKINAFLQAAKEAKNKVKNWFDCEILLKEMIESSFFFRENLSGENSWVMSDKSDSILAIAEFPYVDYLFALESG